MKKRVADPNQGDLFAWADSRPRAIILNAIPRIAARMWSERFGPIHQREGRLIDLPAHQKIRRIA